MTVYRIRAGRDSPATGAYDWAALDGNGTILDSGSAPLRVPPAKSECELLLACDLVLLDAITVSVAQQRRLSSSLRFLVEDSTISGPEQLHVAAACTAAKNVLQVGIVDRQWMTQMLGRLDRSGLVVRAAYPECLLPELPPRGWALVWNGEHSFVRTGEFDGFALDLCGEGEVPVALRLALDIARTKGSIPEKIVARTAAGTTLPALDRWSTTLGVPIEPGPAWHWAGAPHRPGLDLLQAEFARHSVDFAWSRSWRVPALLAAALAILTLSGLALDWAMQVRERDDLTAGMHQIYRSTFGEAAAVVDAPLQMQRGLAQLRREAGRPGADDFLVLLAAAAERSLDPARLRIDSIVYGSGALTLAVRPIDASQFGALVAELRSKSPARGVDIKVEPAEAAGTISLRVTAGQQGGI